MYDIWGLETVLQKDARYDYTLNHVVSHCSEGWGVKTVPAERGLHVLDQCLGWSKVG